MRNQGYIALTLVLVITVLIVVIGTSVSLLSVGDMQASLAGKKSEENLVTLEACAEEALLRLNINSSIPSTITLPQGTCSVTINSQVGENWNFTLSTSLDSYTKKINIQAVKTFKVEVVSWKEVT